MQNIIQEMHAREIMDKDFPIVDSSLPLIKCVESMNKGHEACFVIKNGNFYRVLGKDTLLRGLMYCNDKEATIEKIKIKKNFAVVSPNSGVAKTISLMKKKNVDFIVVKSKKKFFRADYKKRNHKPGAAFIFKSLNTAWSCHGRFENQKNLSKIFRALKNL
jgi:predicted transcriptional regulator